MTSRVRCKRPPIRMDSNMKYNSSSSSDEKEETVKNFRPCKTDDFGDSSISSISSQKTPSQSAPVPSVSPMSFLSYETTPPQSPSPRPSTSSSTEYGFLAVDQPFYPEIRPDFACIKGVRSQNNSTVSQVNFGEDRINCIYVSQRERNMKSTACPPIEAQRNIGILKTMTDEECKEENIGLLGQRFAGKKKPSSVKMGENELYDLETAILYDIDIPTDPDTVTKPNEDTRMTSPEGLTFIQVKAAPGFEQEEAQADPDKDTCETGNQRETASESTSEEEESLCTVGVQGRRGAAISRWKYRLSQYMKRKLIRMRQAGKYLICCK